MTDKKNQMDKSKTIDLDNPIDAKKFLHGVRIHGEPIAFILVGKAPYERQLNVEDMTDKELVRYAKDVYFDFAGGVEGQGGTIKLEGVDQ